MKQKHVGFFLLLLLTGCGKLKTAYETTILLKDWHGNPVANQEVRWHKPVGTSSKLDTLLADTRLRTDATGKVVFNYDLVEDDSFTEYATFYVKNQPQFKSLNYVRHFGPSKAQSEKKQFTIKMDSLIEMKIRVVKNDMTSNHLILNLYVIDKGENPIAIYRDPELTLRNAGRLDTIIHRFCLKNASTELRIDSWQGNNWRGRSQLFTAQQYRDSLMTFFVE